jgi:uncharacterized protein (DUF1697 family)
MIRGIGPGDPRLTNERLRSVFEAMGYADVRSIIASGNIVFSSDSVPSEAALEHAFEAQLGLLRPIMLRSQAEIQHLIDLQPFDTTSHDRKHYTLVTFLKKPISKLPFSVPFTSKELFFVIRAYDMATNALFSITDHTAVPTPKVMVWLEKQFGKENVTSRTWKTVERIHKAF